MNGICFMLEGTEHFMYQLLEVEGVMKAHGSRDAEVSNTQLPVFLSVTLVK
jgi:hypothetical protein